MHTPPPDQGLQAGGRAGRGDLHSHTAAPMHIPGSELRALLRNDLRFNSSPFQHSHQQVTSWWISVGGSPRQRGEQTARGSRCLRKLLNFYQSPSAMTLNVDITETHLVPNIRLLIAELNQNRGPKKLGDKNQHKQPIYFFFFFEAMERKYCGLWILEVDLNSNLTWKEHTSMRRYCLATRYCI